jgi:ribosomal protein L21
VEIIKKQKFKPIIFYAKEQQAKCGAESLSENQLTGTVMWQMKNKNIQLFNWSNSSHSNQNDYTGRRGRGNDRKCAGLP